MCIYPNTGVTILSVYLEQNHSSSHYVLLCGSHWARRISEASAKCLEEASRSKLRFCRNDLHDAPAITKAMLHQDAHAVKVLVVS